MINVYRLKSSRASTAPLAGFLLNLEIFEKLAFKSFESHDESFRPTKISNLHIQCLQCQHPVVWGAGEVNNDGVRVVVTGRLPCVTSW